MKLPAQLSSTTDAQEGLAGKLRIRGFEPLMTSFSDLEIHQPGGARSSVPSIWAFTLIEVLIATAIFATVLIAMNTVFYAALRLRKTTSKLVEDAIPVNHALSVMKRDLRATLAPGGVLAGSITGGRQSGSLGNLSSRMGGQSGGSDNQLSTLQIYTTTGITDDSSSGSVSGIDSQPWSETQKIAYYLREPLYSTDRAGKELVRSITRNLLAVTQEINVEEPLMEGVETVEFLFYDGTTWKDSWDSSSDTTTNLQAIKVQIEFAMENRDDQLRRPLLELVVPVTTQARTNQVSSGGTNSAAQGASATPGGGGQPAGSTQPGGRTPTAGGGGQAGGSAQPGGGAPAAGGQRGGGGR